MTLATLLFCTLTLVFSKFGLGQVGIAWDPSYVAANQAACGAGGCGGGPLVSGFRNQFNALNFNSADPNDEQRRVLFEYYNANRFETYSADGISGWDTSCSLNPLINLGRQRAANRNLASPTGAGTMRVDPFMKRGYVAPAAHAKYVPQTMSSPLAKEPVTKPAAKPVGTDPIDEIPNDIWLPEINETPKAIDAEQLEYPPPSNYDDVAPEFEWDESLLEELPELNHGDPGVGSPMGNPLPPTSAELDDRGAIRRRRQSHSAKQPRLTQRPVPSVAVNPLQAAIQLQSVTQGNRGPVNALDAAIALEAK